MPLIRALAPSDEAALVDVCMRTADAGSDGTGILHDDALWADLFALPYARRHPDLAWVVETDDGHVTGYILATDDTDAFEQWFRDEWWPSRTSRYARSGERQQELLRCGDGRGPGNEKQAGEYPAHLHIDLLPVVQGGGVGRRLIATLLDELRRRGVRGVHLGVDPQNVGAAAFYERLGFERLPSPEGSVRYGIRIAPVDDERQAQATAGRTDAASLLIHTDQARVFDALTREDALLAWLPPRGMHGRFERFDMREGGSFRLVLTYDDASAAPGKSTDDSDVSETRISALVAGERVVHEVEFESDDPALRGTMRMEWSLRRADGGTIVEIVARNVPAGIRARDHAEGLTSSLSNLAAYLEP